MRRSGRRLSNPEAPDGGESSPRRSSSGRRMSASGEPVGRERANVKVICRFRPANAMETQRGTGEWAQLGADGVSVRMPAPERDEETIDFAFDRVLPPSAGQADVYGHVDPVVRDVLGGFNGTIFAYGQTSSGKTHTMEGPSLLDDEARGIIPRAVQSLFDAIGEADDNVEFAIKASMVEIYMERVRDLLDLSKDNLRVRETKEGGTTIIDVSEVYVTEPSEALELLQTGKANRQTAETNMNVDSSRSHSIFFVQVTQTRLDTGSVRVGKLYLVDLAGSEKVRKTGAVGQRLSEAKTINKSLSVLAKVINALTDGVSSHVPYRDSKLTRVLKESLGGNSRTALVVCCSPSKYNADETLSTLRFGSRAKRIQNRAVVNEEKSLAEVKQLLAEASREREALQERLRLWEGGDLASKALPGVGVEGEELLRHEVERVRAVQEAAQAECEALKEELETQRDRVAELECAQDESALGALKEEFDALKSALQSETSSLRAELAASQSALLSSQSETSSLRAELAESRAELSSLGGVTADLEEAQAHLEETKRALAESRAERASAVERAVAEVREELSRVEGERQRVDEARALQRTRADALEEEVEAQRDRLQRLEEHRVENAALRAQISSSTADAALAALQERLQQSERHCAERDAELAEARDREHDSHRAQVAAEEEASRLHARVDELSAAVRFGNSLKSEAAELQTLLMGELAELEGVLDKREEDLRATRRESVALVRAQKAAQREVSTAKEEAAAAKEEAAAAISAAKEEASAAISVAKEEASAAREEASAAREEAAAAKEEAAAAREQAAPASEEPERPLVDAEAMIQAHRAMVAQMEAMAEQLQNSERRCEELTKFSTASESAQVDTLQRQLKRAVAAARDAEDRVGLQRAEAEIRDRTLARKEERIQALQAQLKTAAAGAPSPPSVRTVRGGRHPPRADRPMVSSTAAAGAVTLASAAALASPPLSFREEDDESSSSSSSSSSSGEEEEDLLEGSDSDSGID